MKSTKAVIVVIMSVALCMAFLPGCVKATYEARTRKLVDEAQRSAQLAAEAAQRQPESENARKWAEAAQRNAELARSTLENPTRTEVYRDDKSGTAGYRTDEMGDLAAARLAAEAAIRSANRAIAAADEASGKGSSPITTHSPGQDVAGHIGDQHQEPHH